MAHEEEASVEIIQVLVGNAVRDSRIVFLGKMDMRTYI
jgi:hypothetical protein